MAGHQPCSNCSAPLPMGMPGAVVTCAYCRTENRMAGLTGMMPVHPPVGPAATPLDQAETRRFVRRVIGFVIVMTVLPPLLVALVWMIVLLAGGAAAIAFGVSH